MLATSAVNAEAASNREPDLSQNPLVVEGESPDKQAHGETDTGQDRPTIELDRDRSRSSAHPNLIAAVDGRKTPACLPKKSPRAELRLTG
jgi:hypothetical protein